MKKCRECGMLSPDETIFCRICGTKFPTNISRSNRARFNRGYISEDFVTDAENMEAVLDNPAILITDYDISDVADILPLLGETVRTGSQLLIIANTFEKVVADTLAINKVRGTLSIGAVMAPAYGDRKKAMLMDISILTGGKVVSSDYGLELKNATLSLCGKAQKVNITKDETIIIGGYGSPKSIEERILQLKKFASNTYSDFDREKTQERLIELFGCMESEVC